jgi:hypothetical protein
MLTHTLNMQVAGTNATIQRADMQKAALEALMEVRREVLQQAFGAKAKVAGGQTHTQNNSPGNNSSQNNLSTSDGSGLQATCISMTAGALSVNQLSSALTTGTAPLNQASAGEQGRGLMDISHVLSLEEQIEALQTEIIDMQVRQSMCCSDGFPTQHASA